MEQTETKLAKWIQFDKDPRAVTFDELTQITEKLEFIAEKLEPLNLEEASSIEGDDGHSPIKGEDYFTDEELNDIKDEILEEATPVKGFDYFTDEEKAEFLKAATPVKGVDYKDGIDGTNGVAPTLDEVKKAVIGDTEFVASLKGEKGDAADIEPQLIADTLNTLPDSVDFRVIKGLSERLAQTGGKTISSKRIKVLIGGVEQSEPLGSINFASGVTHVGQDYTVTSGGAGITAWTANTAYSANDVVYQGTNFYKRIASGTSGATFDAAEEALWNVMGTTGSIATWATANYYEIGEVVTNNGTIYRTTTPHTAGATFDLTEATNFAVIGNYTNTSVWTASTYYPIGKIVTQGLGRVLASNTAHTSSATFDLTEANKWDVIKQADVNPWAANSIYYASEVATYKNGLIKSSANQLTTATFDATESVNWISVAAGFDTWTASTYYYANTIITGTLTGRVVMRTADGISGANFDATEAGNYTLVKPALRQIFSALTYYYQDEEVLETSGGYVRYNKIASGMSGIGLDNDLTLGGVWSLSRQGAYTTIPVGPYTVLETDDMIDLTSGANYIITIPAGRVNPIIKFSTTSLSATPPTINSSGGETMTHPSSFAQVTSFDMPGVTGSASSVQFQKVDSTWRFIA